ncbi:MAG: NAD(+) synthase [Prevotellaceae bacterium]|nr:NAD(+) synthase [Prevotellaceae bacterium]
MNYGFVRVASAIPNVKVGDCAHNAEHIQQLIAKAAEREADIVCFPELSITAYTCQDLFFSQFLLDNAELALMRITDFTRSLDVAVIIGLPVSCSGMLLNCAVVVCKGKILGAVPKSYLPNYKEFYEMRWFVGAAGLPRMSTHLAGQTVTVDTRQIFQTPSCSFGVELCEDLWAPEPPGTALALAGAEIIFNLSASNDVIGKDAYLNSLLSQQSARTHCGYIYSGCGFGESTQDLVFGGKAMIYEDGHLLAQAERFSLDEQIIFSEIDVERLRAERRTNTTFTISAAKQEANGVKYTRIDVPQSLTPKSDFSLTRVVDAHPFVPVGKELDARCNEIFNIQVRGLAKRIVHVNCDTLVVGISGGLDSTLALLVCVKACDLLGRSRHSVVGITMPGYGTTSRTYTNATNLMKILGITIREISIAEACDQHFRDLGHDPAAHDLTYENSQARERTQILMDAANQMNGIVVGTGDLSELALGWATYNGDHMSMYGVNVSVPKTLVRHLVEWTARNIADEACRTVLEDIAATPISPELLPADEDDNITQKTEDLVGPYELHDFFLYYFLRFGFSPRKIEFMARTAFAGSYDEDTIRRWLRTFLRRFFQQQFKRSCLPDGPKVGSCSLSPRGDWRMPTDADVSQWLKDLE